MKQHVQLSEDDIKEAIREYVGRNLNISIDGVSLSYHHAPSGDPRERSSFSATAFERERRTIDEIVKSRPGGSK